MASIYPPLNIQYYLEEHVATVIEATPLQVTYKAYDHDAAVIAAASLIAHGHKAHCFPVARFNHTDWLVHSVN